MSCCCWQLIFFVFLPSERVSPLLCVTEVLSFISVSRCVCLCVCVPKFIYFPGVLDIGKSFSKKTIYLANWKRKSRQIAMKDEHWWLLFWHGWMDEWGIWGLMVGFTVLVWRGFAFSVHHHRY